MFVQISDENLHHVRELMDEVFGAGELRCDHYVSQKTTGQRRPLADQLQTIILWYAQRSQSVLSIDQLYLTEEGWRRGYGSSTIMVELAGWDTRRMTR